VPDATADVAFGAFVLHEANEPAGFRAECARLVKATGVVAIIEWRHDADIESGADRRTAVPAITALAKTVDFHEREVTNLDDERVLIRLTRHAG
jgi:ubiquinone/menaquinone biosynthesis C-methylase UbiE